METVPDFEEYEDGSERSKEGAEVMVAQMSSSPSSLFS